MLRSDNRIIITLGMLLAAADDDATQLLRACWAVADADGRRRQERRQRKEAEQRRLAQHHGPGRLGAVKYP